MRPFVRHVTAAPSQGVFAVMASPLKDTGSATSPINPFSSTFG